MGEKVFLLRDADVSGKKLLWDAGLEVVVAKGAGESAWIEEMQREQPAAILTRADRVSAAMMDACPGLKAIGKQGIGLDCIDMDVATQRGIQVVYAPVSNVNAAAEHTMFMIMACARRFSSAPIWPVLSCWAGCWAFSTAPPPAAGRRCTAILP